MYNIKFGDERHLQTSQMSEYGRRKSPCSNRSVEMFVDIKTPVHCSVGVKWYKQSERPPL